MSFTVAIIGRPNVGKSTLFNRLVGKRLALVDDLPGVTRDRREAQGHIARLEFRVIDTAGLEEVFDNSLEARMRKQTELALAEAQAEVRELRGSHTKLLASLRAKSAEVDRVTEQLQGVILQQLQATTSQMEGGG